MKAPFIFRLRPNMLFSFIAAKFAAQNMPDRGGSNPSGMDPAPRRADRISKKERKRREHIRRINPHRKH